MADTVCASDLAAYSGISDGSSSNYSSRSGSPIDVETLSEFKPNTQASPKLHDSIVEPRPESKPEEYVIYKSMNFLPFTTRYDMLRKGTALKLVDLNPRQALQITDNRPPEFSRKKCRALKYVTIPSDSSSSDETSSVLGETTIPVKDELQEQINEVRCFTCNDNNQHSLDDNNNNVDLICNDDSTSNWTFRTPNHQKMIYPNIVTNNENSRTILTEESLLQTCKNKESEAAEILLSIANSGRGNGTPNIHISPGQSVIAKGLLTAVKCTSDNAVKPIILPKSINEVHPNSEIASSSVQTKLYNIKSSSNQSGPGSTYITIIKHGKKELSMLKNQNFLNANKTQQNDLGLIDDPDFKAFASSWHGLCTDVAGNSIHKCTLCCKVYTVYDAFISHVRVHYKQQNKCSVCGKTFSRSWLLKGHMRTHTGERPYVCNYPGCDKAFADRSNLRSHTMIHQTQGKQYVCPVCHRAFAQKRYLHKHMAEVCKAQTCEGSTSVHLEEGNIQGSSYRTVLPKQEDLSNYDTNIADSDMQQSQ